MTYFEGALAALQHLPDSPDRRAQAIDLRFDLRMALLPWEPLRVPLPSSGSSSLG